MIKMVIGAHVSAAGGVSNIIPRARELGVTVVQIFASPPQSWRPSKITLEEAKVFRQSAREAGITDLFFHSIYLINLASDNPELVEKSIASLTQALNLNRAMGGNGVIFHVGSSKKASFEEARDGAVENINKVLAGSDKTSTLIIETNAGQGNCLGDTFEEIAYLLNDIKAKERVGVCLDSAHIFASGYDLVGRGARAILDQFDRVIGLPYLKAVHANDSKTPFNSRVDRHENIGYGQIGEAAFYDLLHQPTLENIPFILEVPGLDGKSGPDKGNVDKLKELAA